jgi:hypothetical protein
MSQERTCPDCGATLPADAPRGLCPECLMAAAFPRTSNGSAPATSAFEPANPGVLDTIAQSIGPVPRVLLRDTAPGEEPGPIVRPAGDHDDDRSLRFRIDGELEPADLAMRIRRRREAVAIELSAFLDDWSAVRRAASRPAIAWQKPLEAARLADPEPYRDRLRQALLAKDRRREAGALKSLAAAPEAAKLPAPTAVLLGRALADIGEANAAVALLRPAAFRHVGDN